MKISYKKGLTLVETIMAIAIFTLALGALFSSVLILYRTYDYTWQQSVAIDEARRGIETMVKEIRTARFGEDGSYPIEKAEDKELIFYSDIDNDGKTERVRYFLGAVGSGSEVKECQSSLRGGSCGVVFSDFLKGNLISAQVKVSLDGDLGSSNEYVEIFADNVKLGNMCLSGCSDCLGAWQGLNTFDVSSQVNDNSVSFLADASYRVDPLCNNSYSMKARFELSWTEDLSNLAHEFKKGIIKPVISQNGQVSYPADQEQIYYLSSYVRNVPPIFQYFDANGNRIDNYPARLTDTKMVKLYLVVNVDPNRPPYDFEIESYVQMRNLKLE